MGFQRPKLSGSRDQITTHSKPRTLLITAGGEIVRNVLRAQNRINRDIKSYTGIKLRAIKNSRFIKVVRAFADLTARSQWPLYKLQMTSSRSSPDPAIRLRPALLLSWLELKVFFYTFLPLVALNVLPSGEIHTTSIRWGQIFAPIFLITAGYCVIRAAYLHGVSRRQRGLQRFVFVPVNLRVYPRSWSFEQNLSTAYVANAIALLFLSYVVAHEVSHSLNQLSNMLVVLLGVSGALFLISLTASQFLFWRGHVKSLTSMIRHPSTSNADLRVIASACTRPFQLPSQAWNPKEDLHQRILFRAVWERLLVVGEYQFDLNFNFFIRHSNPILFPFLSLLVSPLVYYLIWGAPEKALMEFAFGYGVISWAIASSAYLFSFAYWHFAPVIDRYQSNERISLADPLTISKAQISYVRAKINGKSVSIASSLVFVMIPFYDQLTKYFYLFLSD